jgi:hypothetical protein
MPESTSALEHETEDEGIGAGPDLLTDRLTAWAKARDTGERVAVAALIQEGDALARADVRALLVRETDSGEVHCDWLEFEARYRFLDLGAGERAFLDYVIALRFPRKVALWPVGQLGEERLVVVLRAMVALAGADAVAVGTRC